MTDRKPPTLEDVAKAANVSTATISRAINDPSKVAKSTREAITAAIDQLGYTPNFGGRALASSRTNTVGAIIPSMANAMFASGVQAFQEELTASGVTLLLASTAYDAEHEFRQIRSLVAHGADGLLLIGAERPEKTREFLKLRGIPHVLSWCTSTQAEHLYSGFDNEKAAYQMACHVLRCGHRDIAMIAGRARGNDRAAARVAGVRRAIAEAKVNARLLAVVEAEYLLQDGSDAFSQLLSRDDRPSAVICGNDVLASGAILEAKRRGISVPRDMSITGFDDIGLAKVSDPAITTVKVPQIEMGRSAARLLLARISGETDLKSLEFDTEIVERQSLSAPRLTV